MAIPLDQIEQKIDNASLKLDDKTVTTNTLLFELKYKDKTSYLLPTCHFFPYRRLHEDIKRIISKTDILVSETEELYLHLEEFFIPDAKKLYNHLPSEETKNKLKIMFENLCSTSNVNKSLPIEDIPLWCFAFLTLKFYWPELGVDFELHNIFKNTKKPILGLDDNSFSEEDLEPHLEEYENYFREKSDEEMINNMEYYLNYEHMMPGLQCMFDEYVICKTDANYAFDPTNQEDHNQVTYRNFLWAPKIMAILEDHPSTALFAVGMTHLFGPTGLLNILKESDVCIRRMGVDGRFYPYHTDLPTTCSTKQLKDQQQNYEVLKSQILEPQKASVLWLYKMAYNKLKKEDDLKMCYEDKKMAMSISRRYCDSQ